SGKSTLLSVLSRVYLPTSGSATIRGRLISLLELGAGFNPELTGEENVYFNAAVHGLPPESAAKVYQDIVAFSELGNSVMDLPVRMYSSGMQMRLGFAIAIHINADILIVDEALSVGDDGFRRKCYARMAEIRAAGKTLINVTHSKDISFADRVIWLDKGKLIADGDPVTLGARYLESFQK
ncbi:MAG: ABC transporter ATP-binding protein, partial [Capsulimonadaceae bacterium]